MPLIMLGWDYTSIFWSKNWYLPVIFVLILGALNSYFIINWKVFHYLEREDWDSLITHIEDTMYAKGRYREQLAKILLNAYLVKSDIAAIGKAEEKISSLKPQLLPKIALQLGIPHLLKNEPKDMLSYYSKFTETAPPSDRDWIRWNRAFALMMDQNREEAKKELAGLLEKTKDPLVKLLTLYLMDSYSLSDPGMREKTEAGKKALKDKYPLSSWENVVERGRTNVQVVVLSKLLKDAQNWLFTAA